MDLIIKKASIKDAKELNNLLTKLIQDEKKYDKNINENFKVISFYENLIENDDNCALVALVNDEIVGYIYGYITHNDSTYINDVAYLDAMFVDIKYRKNGIGRSLVQEFKKWAKDKGAKYIELKVCSNNIDAVNLYEKENFLEIKKIMSLEIK